MDGWRRAGWWRVGAAALALVVAAGCGLGGGDDDTARAVTPVAEESVPVVTETVDPDTEPEPSSTPSAKPKKTKATPTRDPNNFTEPECAEREGRKVSKAKAKAALRAAAGRSYWPASAPRLKVPVRLVLATAWQESGWQSNIVNCDGGRGLMQVMPQTQEFVNTRFEKSYDAHDYRQNAVLGANYLAWLTKYFGDNFFDGSYNLSAGKCRTHASRCLLNMVIAGYNAGPGQVEMAYPDKRLPNPGYVDSVRSLMKSCYCDRY